MKAIILAAGYATRLYPLTKNKPKSLLEISNIPIITYIVEKVNELEVINELYIITNELFFKDFINWKKNIKSRLKIEIINDGTNSLENKLGAIGDLNFCINKKNINEDILVIAGDNFFDFSLINFYNFYNTNKKDSVLIGELENKELLNQFGVAVVENNKIIDLVEKPKFPKSNIVVYAIYFYTQETVKLISEYLKNGNNPDAPGNFVSWLYKIKDVLAYKIEGECFDIGTFESYNDALTTHKFTNSIKES
ncbi:MAG: nucleotidyltransferase family protein [Defluviitaleaceae bacterium]|nr:nucleotidyltransferase family protein [Defluviitaleaceae bacterium]